MTWSDMTGTIDSTVEHIPMVRYGTGRRTVPHQYEENRICCTNTLIASKNYLIDVYMHRKTE